MRSASGAWRRARAPVWAALAWWSLGLVSPLPAIDLHRALNVERLTNIYLSPQYSLWLVGPIAAMATQEEVKEYLQLRDDAQAEAFIEEFWRRRDTRPQWPENRPRELFEERAEEADKIFRETGRPGRYTARGMIYILYGPPTETRYDISPHPDDPLIEVWIYSGEEVTEGLDGRRPAGFYRFIKRGEVTEFYTPRRGPRRPRIGGPP